MSEWVCQQIGGALITTGKVRTFPGSNNVIPGETAFTVDIRHPSEEGLAKAICKLDKETANAALLYLLEEMKTHPSVHFSKELLNSIEEECSNLGFN